MNFQFQHTTYSQPGQNTIIRAPQLNNQNPLMPLPIPPTQSGVPVPVMPQSGVPIPGVVNQFPGSLPMGTPNLLGQINGLNPMMNNQAVAQPPAQKPQGEQWKKLWIGRIPEELTDEAVKKLLSFAGLLVSWKRTKKSDGNLTTFGFVEFNQVESVLKCIRLIEQVQIIDENCLKVRPSEQTQKFLNEWKELKIKQWNLKTEDEKLGFKTFDEFLQKDDNQFRKDAERFVDELQSTLDKLKKEKQKDEIRKEHFRERERDKEKAQRTRDLDRKSHNTVKDWLRYEEDRVRKIRDRERHEKQVQERQKKRLALQLDMDSEDERHFVKSKYRDSKRQRFRQNERDQDDRQRQKEYEKLNPPKQETKLNAQNMEIERESQKPLSYKPTFKLQSEGLFVNPERQQMIADSGSFALPEQGKMEIEDNNVAQGFGEEEEEQLEEQDQKSLGIKIPGTEGDSRRQKTALEIQELELQAEKEREVKAQLQDLIGEIPKGKDELFQFEINWTDIARSGIIDKKIKPWLIKKSKEYLNEVEMDFVKIVIKKLNNANSPESIVKKVEFILDEDAEGFVVKLWRALIFEFLKLQKGFEI